MRTVSLSTDSLIAMVPDRECRMPTLMVFSSAAAGGTANASCKKSNPQSAASLTGSKMASCRCPDELEDAGFLCHALGDDGLDSSELEAVLNPQIDIFADEDCGPKLLVQAFEARCQIHRIAKRRVVHAFRRSEIADDGLPNMNAKPREERLQSLGLELSVELFARRFARKRCPASPLDMVRLTGRVRSRTPSRRRQ